VYAAVRYVKPTATGSGDGSSWADASNNLQAMINASAAGDEVWVAAGTYKPSAYPSGCIGCSDARFYSFHLKNGVKLYGSFSGSETAVSQRNIAANPTTLSGDFNDDDVVTGTGSTLSVTVNTTNAAHVVLSISDDNTTVFDGFTVRGGALPGAGNITVESSLVSTLFGAGMFNASSSVTIANCIFVANKCYYGGGLYNIGSSSNITNCTFLNNYAQFEGGGMYNEASTALNITNCSFTGNYVFSNSGGGIHNVNSSSSIANCIFTTNWGGGAGGGLYNQGSSPSITNCIFIGNSSNSNGGGIFNNSFSTPAITNTTFVTNSSNAGGGMNNSSSSPTITNCTFYGNTASSTGGIMFNFQSSPVINNCVMWGNSSAISNISSTPTVSYSTVQGGHAGTGNLNTNPLFVNTANIAGPDGIHRTADDGLRLQIGSPAINAGNNATIPAGITTDITGAARIQNTTVDMGAYEGGVFVCPTATTFYVDQSVSSSGNGTSWATAFKTLDEALFVAHTCPNVTTINVAAGTYKPTKKPFDGGVELILSNERFNTFHIPSNVAMYGGYPSGGGTRDVAANPTILSGDLADNDVFDINNGGYQSNTGLDNCFHVVLMLTASGHTSILDGFYVLGGNANAGGHLFVNGDFIFNEEGGGVSAYSYGTQILNNNTFYHNRANLGGGVFAINRSIQTLSNNTHYHNRANLGGGVFAGSNIGSQRVANNVFYGNVAISGGGVYAENTSTQTLCNNTIYNNAAVYVGGGVYASNNAALSTQNHHNNLFWDNLQEGSNDVEGADIYRENITGTYNFTHNLTQANSIYSSGTGIINNQNPLFVNPANPAGADGIHRTADDGLRLQTGSPVINAGSNAAIPAGITTDITGAARIQSGTVDMGAYEAESTGCPNLTAPAPAVLVESQSICTNCLLYGGLVKAPATECPAGATLQFSINNGDTWTATMPIYNQTTPITILTRCICDADNTTVSPTSSVTTVPGVCSPVIPSISGSNTACDSVTLIASGGTTYLWSGGSTPNQAENTFTTSDIYTVTVTNSSGCTATTSATITITASTSNTTTASACDSYTWSVNGQTYTTSGSYTHTVGCHTETLNLTITASTSNTTTASACDSYTWSVNGQTYTTSGSYTHTVGCHTETLNLTITASTGNTTTASACDSYMWSVNGQTYTTSGSYTHTVGCHTETLNLTITTSTGNTTTVSACDSYTWSVNGQTYTTSGSYTHTVGCHTETLNLTITTSTGNTTTASACDSYTWSVNGQTYTTSGSYTHTVGCHTETLNLTITGACPDCEGTPGGTAQPGTPCDDGNPNTQNDVYNSNCQCIGTPIPLDCEGTPNGSALPGTPCDDGNPDTENDMYGSNCVCAGTPISTLCNLGATLNGTTNVCVGGVIGLVATGGNQYQWSGPNGYNVASGGSITRTNATVAMSGTYTVTITNNTCVDILSITVAVHPIPSATITGANAVCSGGTISLSVPAGAVGYAWSGPSGFTSTDAAILLPNATTAMAGAYKVTVTGAGGCTATASRSVSVTVPTVAAITGATSVCGNNPITLTCTTAGVSYQWSGPGGFSFSGATMTRTPAVAGTYTVTVTNATGCISTANRTVSVNAVPNLVVTNNSNCTRIWLIALGGNSYTWSGPNGYTFSGSTVLRNPATAAMWGTYTVTATGTGGCTTTASITVSPCSSKTITDESGFSLSVYPNPFSEITNVQFVAERAEMVKLAIYATDGREVALLFEQETQAETAYTLPFDGNQLPSGTYFVVLQKSNGHKETLPLMLVR